MHEALSAVLEATSPAKARAAFEQAVAKLEGKADKALAVFEEGFEDATAVLALPPKYRRRLRTSNMIERFIEEIRRREKVIRIFPGVQSVWRLVGALCVEKHEEWPRREALSDNGRVLPLESIARRRATATESSLTDSPLNARPDGMANYTQFRT